MKQRQQLTWGPFEKGRRVRPVVAFLIVAAGLLGASVCQAYPRPLGWQTSAWEDLGSAYRSGYAHGGAYSVALVRIDSVKGHVWTEVDIVNTAPHEFSVWYDMPPSDGMVIIWIVEMGEDGGLYWHEFTLDSTRGWTLFSETIYMYSLTYRVAVSLRCVEGSVFFDDIALINPYNILPNPGFEVWLDTLVGIDEVQYSVEEGTASLTVYPNPCKGRAEIRAVVHSGDKLQLKIYDTSGRLVKRYEISGSNSVSIEWDGRDYASRPVPSGTYFVRLDSGSKTVCERITVIR